MRRFMEYNIHSFSGWNQGWDMTLFMSNVVNYDFYKRDMRDWLFT